MVGCVRRLLLVKCWTFASLVRDSIWQFRWHTIGKEEEKTTLNEEKKSYTSSHVNVPLVNCWWRKYTCILSFWHQSHSQLEKHVWRLDFENGICVWIKKNKNCRERVVSQMWALGSVNQIESNCNERTIVIRCVDCVSMENLKFEHCASIYSI